MRRGRAAIPRRSAARPGIVVEPTPITGSEAKGFGVPIRGSPAEIAERLSAFEASGFTQVEVVLWPPTPAALDAMQPVLEHLDAA